MLIELAKVFSNPLLIFFFIAIGWLLIRRVNKLTITVPLLIFYLATTSLPYNLTIRFWDIPDTISFNNHYDGLIILSGVTDLKWYQFQKDRYPEISYLALNKNRERIFAGVQFMKLDLADQMFFGNLSDDSFGETQVVKRFVLRQGISEDRFISYGNVKSTRDEAASFLRLIEDSSSKRLLLITSEVHMRRAVDSFLKQGIEVDTFSVGRYNRNVNWEEFIPSIAGVSLNQRILYEMYGWIGYYLQGDI